MGDDALWTALVERPLEERITETLRSDLVRGCWSGSARGRGALRVATGHPRILLCGAGAARGGGVSGIGGHNAAMAVLADE